jgi:hypothetical protein
MPAEGLFGFDALAQAGRELDSPIQVALVRAAPC